MTPTALLSSRPVNVACSVAGRYRAVYNLAYEYAREAGRSELTLGDFRRARGDLALAKTVLERHKDGNLCI
jgi:hypothetical protein